MTTLTDPYPSRAATEVAVPRQDPVVWGAPDAPGPISVPELHSYERDGFLSVEQLIGEDEAAVYRQELERLVTDPAVRADERSIIEPQTQEIRSVFEVHRISEVFARLVRDERVVGRARQILGSDVYVHQSRINVKPGFGASGFYWHSDFETWHAEDGLPNMRAVSVSIALTENHDTNGGLMIMPGSHRTFLGCAGATPKDNYKKSLQMQDAGTPSDEALTGLAKPARHQALHGQGRFGDLVRLQLHARLGGQHHPVPAQQRLHRVQQRGQRRGGAVRGTGAQAGVHRGAGLHSGAVTSPAG